MVILYHLQIVSKQNVQLKDHLYKVFILVQIAILGLAIITNLCKPVITTVKYQNDKILVIVRKPNTPTEVIFPDGQKMKLNNEEELIKLISNPFFRAEK